MIEIKKNIPEDLKPKDFYTKLEEVSGLKLHRDFNCTLKFNDDAQIISIAVIGNGITESQVKNAAGVKPNYGSVGNFFRDAEDES